MGYIYLRKPYRHISYSDRLACYEAEKKNLYYDKKINTSADYEKAIKQLALKYKI